MPVRVPNEIAEADLLARVHRGERAALAVLFERHSPAVYRVAYRLLRCREDAEELVQDVFVGLRTALGRYEERGSFSNWLRQLTARAALQRLRSERRREATAVAAASEPEGAACDPALRMTLDRSVGQLPDGLRSVFVLRLVEGYSHTEIAGMLGISVGASKVRLHRAIKRLQSSLKDAL